MNFSWDWPAWAVGFSSVTCRSFAESNGRYRLISFLCSTQSGAPVTEHNELTDSATQENTQVMGTRGFLGKRVAEKTASGIWALNRLC